MIATAARGAFSRNGVAAMLVALAVVATPADVRAQSTPNSIAADMVGQWELSTTERSKTCVVTLKSDPIAGGMKLELEPNCPTALAFTKDISAWSVKGLDIVRLQTSRGEPVIDFTEVESGIWEGQRSGEGVYILQNLAAARESSKSTDLLIGDWAVVRGNGRPICALTLTNTEADKDNFALYLKPRCDSFVTSFKPVMWRLERGELLMLSASGETWRFEADDNAQWRRVPDMPDPVLLSRQ